MVWNSERRCHYITVFIKLVKCLIKLWYYQHCTSWLNSKTWKIWFNSFQLNTYIYTYRLSTWNLDLQWVMYIRNLRGKKHSFWIWTKQLNNIYGSSHIFLSYSNTSSIVRSRKFRPFPSFLYSKNHSIRLYY